MSNQSPECRTAQPRAKKPPSPAPSWTFLSNHAHVLVVLYSNPTVRLRDVAEEVGITERGAQRIVAELEEGGVISKQRAGRRNQYAIHLDSGLRHPLEGHATVGELLKALSRGAPRR